MAILQSDKVRELINTFHKVIPEVRLKYRPSPEVDNTLIVGIPNTFDQLPEMVRVHATSEIVKLQEGLAAIGVALVPDVYEARNDRT